MACSPLLLLLLLLITTPPTLAQYYIDEVLCDSNSGVSSIDCAACFGPHAIYCGNDTCFDPSLGQTCCADGTYCYRGQGTSDGDGCCGSVGPGIAGSSNSPGTSSQTTAKTASPSLAPAATATTADWSCVRTDDGDACCARRGEGVRFCGGEWPTYTCFRPDKGEVCCAGGTVRACTGTGGGVKDGSNGQAACCGRDEALRPLVSGKCGGEEAGMRNRDMQGRG
ncbi:hypothetical protein HDK77DRAFT_427281 [Phyllosticta capitalensis]|uniref:Uncharacterized protein n=1 Tax=Phyllosticta capitalensis TaxID=121624 RepID=A0ABR1YMD4_9PEZI